MCKLAAKVVCIHTSARQTSSNSDDVFLEVLENSDEIKDPWAVTLTVEGKAVTHIVDTEAEVTVISDQVWKEIEQPPLTDMKPERPRYKAHPVPREVLWYTSISRLRNTRGGLCCPRKDEDPSRSPRNLSAASHPTTHKRTQSKRPQGAVPISVPRTREAGTTIYNPVTGRHPANRTLNPPQGGNTPTSASASRARAYVEHGRHLSSQPTD